MNAEDSLSGFQDFLIQLIINDRANKKIKKEKKQAQRRAAADRSRHKSYEQIQYQGLYFTT